MNFRCIHIGKVNKIIFFWEYIPKFFICQEKNERASDFLVANLWQLVYRLQDFSDSPS